MANYRDRVRPSRRPDRGDWVGYGGEGSVTPAAHSTHLRPLITTSGVLAERERARERKVNSRSIAIMDTSALITIAPHDHMGLSSDRHSPMNLLSWLSDSEGHPPRTLIIPHEVIREFFQHRVAKGTPAIDATTQGIIKGRRGYALNLEYHNFYYTGCNEISDFLHDAKCTLLKGNLSGLRIYPSIDAMLKAGEVDQPKGGVVIVDCGVGLPYKNGKSRFNKSGIYGVYMPGFQMGDEAIAALSERICEHVAEQKPKSRGGVAATGAYFPIITEDDEMKTRYLRTLNEKCLPDMPFSMSPRALVQGLGERGHYQYRHQDSLFKAMRKSTEPHLAALQASPDRTHTRRQDQIAGFDLWQTALVRHARSSTNARAHASGGPIV